MLGGLFSGGSKGPGPSDAAFQDVDPETSRRIEDFGKDASRKKSEALYAEAMSGVEDTPAFLANKTMAGQLGRGVDNDVLMAAIERRASRSAAAQNTLMKSDLQARAIESRFRRLQQAGQLAQAEAQQNERARMNRYLRRQNRRRARASVLGNVLGIGGAVAGAFAGGPAGAMAGYQIGQGVGQAGGY